MTTINILVNDSPPGIGKTHTVKSFIKNNPEKRFVVFSETHRTLAEYTDLPDVIHWKGFNQLCGILKFQEFSKWIAANILCRVGNKLGHNECKNCSYKAQFQTKAQVIIAPFEFSLTKYFDKKRVDHIIIEERAIKHRDLREPSKETIEAQFKLLEPHLPPTDRPPQGVPSIRDVMKTNPRLIYYTFADLLQTEVEKHIEDLLLNGKATFEEITTLCNPMPKEIKFYYELTSKYGQQEIAVPYLLYILALAYEKKADIIINDASVKENVLQMLVSRCQSDLTTFENITFNCKITMNQKTTSIKPFSQVIRINPAYWYPKQSLQDNKTLKRIASDIERIAKAYRLKKLSIITYKSITNKLSDFLQDYELDFLHFGDLRSQNDFKDEEVGFVIGSYNVPKEAVVEKTKQLIPQIREEPEVKRDESRRFVFDDKHYDQIRQMEEDEEVYQSVHRYRPLRKPTTIFVWGIVPEKIKKEMDYYEINRRELKRFLHGVSIKLGKKAEPIEVIIEDLLNEFRQKGFEKIRIRYLEEEIHKRTNKSKKYISKKLTEYIEEKGLIVEEIKNDEKGRGRPPKYLMLE